MTLALQVEGETDLYFGDILWFGEKKTVLAYLVESTDPLDALLGMELLEDCILEIDRTSETVKITKPDKEVSPSNS